MATAWVVFFAPSLRHATVKCSCTDEVLIPMIVQQFLVVMPSARSWRDCRWRSVSAARLIINTHKKHGFHNIEKAASLQRLNISSEVAMKTNVIYLADIVSISELLSESTPTRSIVGDDTFSLISIWSRLDSSERSQLLEVARTLMHANKNNTDG
jgi:hypothetical protein